MENRMLEEEKKVLEEYSRIERDYRYALREMCAKLENLDDYSRETFAHNPIHHIESRMKTKESIVEKMYRRGYDISIDTLYEMIYDIAGIRVICNYIDDIDLIIGLLLEQKNLRVRLKKDYIKNPKESGYRSIHIVFEKQMFVGNTESWIPIEIQFRTIAMDMWASLEHELRYKSHITTDDDTKRKLKQYSDELFELDVKMQEIFKQRTGE